MKEQKFTLQWGGKDLILSTGKLAGQANGACTVQYGDTVVLATVVMSDSSREGISYFPLMVDFEERLYAAGKIKSSRFMKREGRPSDEAVLTGRMIDRAIRPLFDEKVRNDVQVIVTVLSVDGENDSDIPGFIAASAALMISDVPWNGPIGAIRIGRIGGEWVINPSFAAREKSEMDVVVAGTPERVIMLEAGAREVPEDAAYEAIAFGQKHLRPIVELITSVQKAVGIAKRAVVVEMTDEARIAKEEAEALKEKSRQFMVPKIHAALFGNPQHSKSERLAAVDALELELEKHLIEEQVGKEKRKDVHGALEKWVEAEVTRAILEEGKRVDGRALDEVRALSVEIGVLPRTHGSGLFARGETQVVSVVTLGSPADEQTIDGMEFTGKKHYFHHYNFPPYSVGETGPLRGPGRREIGHGALAEKAIISLLPPREEFPYTIRVVSEVLSSNGSSSMASSCCSSLALMDAGVPIKAQVAGVAMGLASDDSGKYKILTDLQDLEDGKGGMDFKVAGTRTGITAIQLDTKTLGLGPDLVRETLNRARAARMKILDAMDAVVNAPRAELSPYAPRITTLKINPEKIRDVIGPGGKMINEIIKVTGAQIDVEDDGTIFITAIKKEGMDKAVDWIKQLTREVKVGEIFTGKVVRLMDFGAFVEILPKQDGMVHISELTDHRVNTVEDAVKIGDMVTVKVIEIDDMGRINLSIRQAANPDAPVEVRQRPPPRSGPRTGGFGHRRPH